MSKSRLHKRGFNPPGRARQKQGGFIMTPYAYSGGGGGGGPLPGGFGHQSSVTAGSKTSNTSFSDWLSASITTTTGTHILVHADLSGYGSVGQFYVQIEVDGVAICESSQYVWNNGWGFSISVQVAVAVSAGAHTVKARVKSGAGSHTLGATYYSWLTAKEF